ncbi:methyl-accepting chemotaxis protein [Geomonas sp. Red32]|uniref:methyl-accepting chemotaxis protein n=1 Tax=Geomonas sp. Red32 TaxID=2912856 RepID=UPI00202CD55D|nr:methyl-accepting chemotaxis protein [Geomonas sp. Red32]MCM0081945.1 methyl-accepting chemotaxis protein [Geomonas sp. Red32]
MLLSRLSFQTKVLLLVIGSCCALGAPTGAVALKKFQQTYTRSAQSYKKVLFQDSDNRIKAEVQTAVSMLQAISDRQQQGETTLEEAKRQGADLLRRLKYGEDGYFWADTSDGTNVVYLGKDAEGKNRLNAKDSDGKLFIQEIINNGKKPEGGFTEYRFPRPGTLTALPKRSYSLYFAPFDWVVGTGNYVDDLQAMVGKGLEADRGELIKGILLIVGLTAVILTLICVAAVKVVRQLISHIGTEPAELEQIAAEVAAGNLTVRLDEGKTGIYEAMRRMVEGLRDVMEKVKESAVDVSASAAALHDTAGRTAEGAQDVMQQTETVASASARMSATSSDIALNCHHAAESSQQASSSARNGSEIVREIVQGMDRIAQKVRNSAGLVGSLGTRSDQIGEIVATIEDIADQTNLLALNAAIEAARAGEQGRGFAVVADEVRALAERTTKATREIGEMIKSIQQETRQAVQAMEEGVVEVERGTGESARSGKALEEILQQINDVTGQISRIATAAEEQTMSTREIAGNIQQISDTAQISANSSREISSASSRLSALSGGMQEVVQRFRL